MLNRIWPDELKAYQSDANAIPMAMGEYPSACPNCGGHGIMMLYLVRGGPFRQPDGGKVKWLDRGEGKSGWYRGELKVSNCPACRGGHMQDYLVRNCGLAGADLDISLDGFRVSGALAGKEHARQVIGELLGQNHRPAGFVTLHGGYGCGKTHLLMSLVNGFRKIGVVSRYAILSDLLADIRKRFGDERVTAEDVIDATRNIRVLCMDEVDGVNLTSWARETINRLVDARYRARDELLTVFAMNANPDNLPVDLGYLASRIAEGLVIEIPGPDVREALGLKTRATFVMGRDS